MDAPPLTLESTEDAPGAFHAAHGSLPLVKLPDAPHREFCGVGGVRPYYEAEGVTIYHGDCLTLLPLMLAKSVDGVVTSPPYNTLKQQLKNNRSKNSAHHGNAWVKKQHTCYADSMDETTYQHFVAYVVSMCLSRSKGLVWVNHKIRFRDGAGLHPMHFLRFPLWSEVIWNRGGGMAIQPRRFLPTHEGFWGFGRPHWWDEKLAGRKTVWEIGCVQDEDHPCPYPERLVAPIIAASIPPGGVVLDPFMGSGTTLLVAKSHGRRAIGMDTSEEYCEMAAKRLAQGVLSLGGGGAELPKPSPAEKEENNQAQPPGLSPVAAAAIGSPSDGRCKINIEKCLTEIK